MTPRSLHAANFLAPGTLALGAQLWPQQLLCNFLKNQGPRGSLPGTFVLAVPSHLEHHAKSHTTVLPTCPSLRDASPDQAVYREHPSPSLAPNRSSSHSVPLITTPSKCYCLSPIPVTSAASQTQALSATRLPC